MPESRAFEGAMYEARGYYRPQEDCIMFTRDEVGFCAVCRRAIERIIACTRNEHVERTRPLARAEGSGPRRTPNRRQPGAD